MDLKFKDNSKLKPANFTQFEYIESTGTQYIDTGFKPNQDTRVVLEFNDLNQSIAFLFGSRIYGNNSEFGYLNGITSGQGARYGNQERTLAITHNVKLTLDANKTNWSLSNGNVATFNSTTFQSSVNCSLFAHNNGGTIYCVSIRVYSCKIYDNNTLIRDFIPAKDTNGVVCLYDTVSQSFFYNQGTGNFIAGPVINPGFPENILLKTTTLYHKNTPNVNGLELLNGILNYQKSHQDEIKEYYYPTTQLWQDIITEYPDILYWYNLNHKFCIPICEANDPEQYAEDFLDAVDNIQQELEDYPGLISIITEYPNIASLLEEWNPLVHSLLDTGYENIITSTGTQYIDTNFIPNQNTKVSCTFNLLNVYQARFVFGCGNAWNNMAFAYGTNDTGAHFYFTFGNAETKDYVFEDKKTIERGKGIQTANAFTSPRSLWILGLNYATSYIDSNPMSLWKFKVYDNDVLVRNLVPFYRNGHYGMLDIHDLSNPVFYPNAGSGEFTYSLEPKNV